MHMYPAKQRARGSYGHAHKGGVSEERGSGCLALYRALRRVERGAPHEDADGPKERAGGHASRRLYCIFRYRIGNLTQKVETED